MHFDSDLVCGEFCCAVKVKKHHVVLSQQPCDPVASDVDVWLISEGYDTSLSHSKPPGRPQGCCRTVCPVIGHGASLRAPTRGGLEVSRCAAVGALSPPAGRPGTPRGRPARWVVAGAAPVPPTGPRKRICPILGHPHTCSPWPVTVGQSSHLDLMSLSARLFRARCQLHTPHV